MKKALSLFLATLLIFGCFAVGASAATTIINQVADDWFGDGEGYAATRDQVIISFDTNGGVFKNDVTVFDKQTGLKTSTGEVAGVWCMVPSIAGSTEMRPGTEVSLPYVTPPADRQFDGWFCYEDGQTYGAGSRWTIPTVIGGNATAGTVLHFRAAYSPAAVEENSLAKIMGILAKVFGAIIGLLLYKGDTEAGIALVNQMLAGIIG